jgi:hypothetical protein
MEGNPKFEATQQIPDVPYHRFGELIGLKGIFCNEADKVGEAWRARCSARSCPATSPDRGARRARAPAAPPAGAVHAGTRTGGPPP